MAPVSGITREALIQRIVAHTVGPFACDLGSPHRNSVVLFDGSTWMLCPMTVDMGRVLAESERCRSSGLSFMPEDMVDMQEPGSPLFAHEDRSAFIKWIQQVPWLTGGPDLMALQGG